MFRFVLITSMLWIALCSSVAAEIQPNNRYPQVKIVTSVGDLVVELNRDRAPITVANFLRYVEKARYNGTIFHRIVPDFVVQGGGYDKEFQSRAHFEEIFNESGNGLANDYGTVAMARDRDPHSGTRQFFFNVADNESLNPSPRRWGYAVFGKVIEGDEVLKKLAETESEPYHEATGWNDVPPEPPEIIRIEVVPQA